MTMKVLKLLEQLHHIDIDHRQLSVVMSVITEITKIAYDEGFEHGKDEGYGEGHADGSNVVVASEGNYNDGWIEGYKAATDDLANGKPNQLEPKRPINKSDDIPF